MNCCWRVEVIRKSIQQRIAWASRYTVVINVSCQSLPFKGNLTRLSQTTKCPIKRLSVVCRKHHKPQFALIPLPTSPTLTQFPNSDEVALRFRHLLALDLEEAVVHPGARHDRRVEGAARLRDFVLVVRKHEIDAAAVDVEGFAEMFPRHGRALEVPAGPAWRGDTGGRRPRRFARLRRLPQHEVHRVALIRRDVDPGAGDQFVERALR